MNKTAPNRKDSPSFYKTPGIHCFPVLLETTCYLLLGLDLLLRSLSIDARTPATNAKTKFYIEWA